MIAGVAIDHIAGHTGGGVADQEGGDLPDLVDGDDAPSWRSRGGLGQKLVETGDAAGCALLQRTGRERMQANALLAEFISEIA